MLLAESGIDPAPHTAAIPTVDGKLSPLRQRIGRIARILNQCKWLAVIAYRNWGLRKST
ncbi:MAG: hypothetical protein JW913_14095 [Chitinispirillaceae bacterium]|nr:hypothetical protein [Chitinispirillaceae bacterium]